MTTESDETPNLIHSALAALKRGDRTEAEQLAQQATHLSPASEAAWLILAALAEPEESLEYIHKALQINPSSQPAQAALNWALKRQPPLAPAPISPRRTAPLDNKSNQELLRSEIARKLPLQPEPLRAPIPRTVELPPEPPQAEMAPAVFTQPEPELQPVETAREIPPEPAQPQPEFAQAIAPEPEPPVEPIPMGVTPKPETPQAEIAEEIPPEPGPAWEKAVPEIPSEPGSSLEETAQEIPPEPPVGPIPSVVAPQPETPPAELAGEIPPEPEPAWQPAIPEIPYEPKPSLEEIAREMPPEPAPHQAGLADTIPLEPEPSREPSPLSIASQPSPKPLPYDIEPELAQLREEIAQATPAEPAWKQIHPPTSSTAPAKPPKSTARASAPASGTKRSSNSAGRFVLFILIGLLVLALVAGVFFRSQISSQFARLFNPIPTPQCVQPLLKIGDARLPIKSIARVADGALPVINQSDNAWWVEGTTVNYVFAVDPTSVSAAAFSNIQSGDSLTIAWADCTTDDYVASTIDNEVPITPSVFDQAHGGLTILIPGSASTARLLIHGVRP